MESVNLKALTKTEIFAGATEEEVSSMLNCLSAKKKTYQTDEIIFHEKLMVNVIAMSDCEVLFLDVRKILKVCPNACEFHQNLVQNLLAISAQKNLNLSRRIFHTSSKTIRGRLLSYLSYQAMERENYLGVDRSAMSNELGKMQKDGLIEVKRNHFRILDVD